VRELEQVVRRIVIDSGGLTDGEVAKTVLQSMHVGQALSLSGQPERSSYVEEADGLLSLDEAERRHILAVLNATGGNQTQAAFILGIERKTLARKIKRFGIKDES